MPLIEPWRPSADNPVEQYLRDSKSFAIHEGTNHIQVLDLVACDRKLPRDAIEPRVIDVRWCDSAGWKPNKGQEGRAMVWMRAEGEMSPVPLLHFCVLVYASDYTLTEIVMRPHGVHRIDHRGWPPASIAPCGSTVTFSSTTGGSMSRILLLRPGHAVSSSTVRAGFAARWRRRCCSAPRRSSPS